MEQSDYLVVCMALTPQTRNLVSAAQIARAKKGMVLISIGRGALIDEQAMTDALINGGLAGAALDVFTVEPLPEDSPLWGLPNVLVSPHNADLTETSRFESVTLFTHNCRKYMAGEPLECVVDKSAGY
jgi:glyoxylate/hydroxypyruvate reductase